MKVHLVLAALGAIVAATLLPASVVVQTSALRPSWFVTQPPFGGDFTSVNATSGNHEANTFSTPRGGDLYIRYWTARLNLTAEAGYGLYPPGDLGTRALRPLVRHQGAVLDGRRGHRPE